jgi:hypothetical protein
VRAGPRPDAHVAWRRQNVAEECASELAGAMDRILGFEQSPNKEASRTEEKVEA